MFLVQYTLNGKFYKYQGNNSLSMICSCQTFRLS